MVYIFTSLMENMTKFSFIIYQEPIKICQILFIIYPKFLNISAQIFSKLTSKFWKNFSNLFQKFLKFYSKCSHNLYLKFTWNKLEILLKYFQYFPGFFFRYFSQFSLKLSKNIQSFFFLQFSQISIIFFKFNRNIPHN